MPNKLSTKNWPAAIYFWDHMTVSPAILIPHVGDDIAAMLRAIIRASEQDRIVEPGNIAALAVIVLHNLGVKSGITNAPMGNGQLGAILSRIHSPGYVIGGAGTFLVDPVADTVSTHGGFGFSRDIEAPLYRVREYVLSEVLAADIEPKAKPIRKIKGESS
jgi:hypothetical protein